MDIAGGGKWARGHGVRVLRWTRGRAVSVRERREWGARGRETKRNGPERSGAGGVVVVVSGALSVRGREADAGEHCEYSWREP